MGADPPSGADRSDPDARHDVRPAWPADRPALSSLQTHLPRPAPALLDAALSGVGTVLVSTADGRAVGYLLAVPGPEVVHVAELVVAPERRREGRASALVRAVAGRFDRPLRLAVSPDDRAARRCYESLGFAVVRRDPEFFGDEPALVMVRER
jgi:ribosomal-protein-alanine N-acetyltransferase